MITIDLTNPDVAALFADCEPGESKTLTFTVDTKTPESISGTIETVEGYPEGGEEEVMKEEGHAPPPMKGGRKMGKQLTIILGH